jgi:threonine/homoserine/homoserine lactone efflux protein
MGWLYGGIVIAVQSAVRFLEAGQVHRTAGIGCVCCAIVCGMVLLAAMNERGINPAWQPPLIFKIAAILIVAVILWFGYSAQAVPKRANSSEQQTSPATAEIESRAGKITGSERKE